MNTINNTTVEAKLQPAVWMVDYSSELVDTEKRDTTRSCDGKWLKRHCKLNAKPVRRFLDGSDE